MIAAAATPTLLCFVFLETDPAEGSEYITFSLPCLSLAGRQDKDFKVEMLM